jgi:hypothetical protein
MPLAMLTKSSIHAFSLPCHPRRKRTWTRIFWCTHITRYPWTFMLHKAIFCKKIYCFQYIYLYRYNFIVYYKNCAHFSIVDIQIIQCSPVQTRCFTHAQHLFFSDIVMGMFGRFYEEMQILNFDKKVYNTQFCSIMQIFPRPCRPWG